MAAQKEVHAPEGENGRILFFPASISLGKRKPLLKDVSKADGGFEVEDLSKYEQDAEPDDYPRRMVVNLIAFAFIVVLTFAGIWLAEQMVSLRKHQDCALTGRTNCADVIFHER